VSGPSFVDEHAGVGVVLQEAGGDHGGDLALDRFGEDRGFAFAKAHHNQAAGGEDRANAHRDRALGHVLDAEEV